MARRFIASFVVICLVAIHLNATRRLDQALPLTPQTLNEAIDLASDPKLSLSFLTNYRIQAHTGFGDGPPIGSFSTPFSRVVQAAVAARNGGETFRVEDVRALLLEPELHVVALFQPALALADDRDTATVQSVTLVPRGSGDPADVIKPTRTVELSEDYKKLIGIKADRGGVLAVFPLASLTSGVEIRVVFDRIARAPSPSCMCRECVVRLNIARIR